MAITNYLVHFKTKATYESTVASNPLRNDAVAFIQDATIIRTHGTDYHCGSGPVALKSELSTVATTGSYNDLTDLPENSEGTYLLDLTSLGDLISGSATGNIGSSAYTSLVNAINDNKLIYVLIELRTFTATYSVGSYKVDNSAVSVGFSVDGSTYSFSINSSGTCIFVKHDITINADQIISGTIDIDRIPTGVTSSTVALGNHTHSNYLTSSSLSGYATQSWCNTEFTTTSEVNSLISSALTGYSTTDTKNTTGTSDSSSKLFLAGGTSQSPAGVVTYSNSSVYTQSGQLYATQMNATNGFYETSDARLKDFKEDVKALDTVDQIPTKYFTWKDDENKESQIGTSAQEVEKLYPELVSKTEDDTLTVDYAKLSIIALAAIKELKAEIQSLEEEIKQLKSN